MADKTLKNVPANLQSGLKLIITGKMNKNQMIAKIAYHNAEERGFEPGKELDDWLAAEEVVERLLENNPDEPVTIQITKKEDEE